MLRCTSLSEKFDHLRFALEAKYTKAAGHSQVLFLTGNGDVMVIIVEIVLMCDVSTCRYMDALCQVQD